MTPSDGTGERPEAEPTRRPLTLRFDGFGWDALQGEADRDREPLDAVLSRAAAYFVTELGSDRPALRTPRFRPGGQGTTRELALALAPARWEHLEAEAGRRGVSLERLVEHAALLYLADLDSGRLADRMLGGAEPGSGRG